MKLLIIDGDNLAHRAYHTTPSSTTDRDNRPINAIVGFFNIALRVIREEAPDAVFVAWDTLGVDTYRNELWPPYQTGRVFDPEIKEQLSRLPDLCEAAGFGVGKQAGYEADDLLGSAAIAHAATGGNAFAFTADRDTYQLVNERITVLSAKPRTRELVRITPQEVVAHFGVLPEQVPAFKALSGDPSDKIPGIPGIGPKTAARLLLQHGTLEGVIADWETEKADRARTFLKVATIMTDGPVKLPTSPPDWESAANAMLDLGAAGLSERMHQMPS